MSTTIQRHPTGSKRLILIVQPDDPDATAEIVAMTLFPTAELSSPLPVRFVNEAAEALRGGFSVRVASDDHVLNAQAAMVIRRAAGMR